MTNCVSRLTVMPGVLKVTVSPTPTSVRAWRSVPAPLSAALVTVMFARPYWYADIAWYDNAV